MSMYAPQTYGFFPQIMVLFSWCNDNYVWYLSNFT